MNEIKQVKKKLKSIRELREAYVKTYNKYAEDFAKLNKQLIELSTQVNDILGFMEKVVQMADEQG